MRYGWSPEFSPPTVPALGCVAVDGLAAVLESNFRWEERRIKDALNSFDVPGLTPGNMFGVTTTAATEYPRR